MKRIMRKITEHNPDSEFPFVRDASNLKTALK